MNSSWQVYHLEEAVSGYSPRGSQLACMVAGRFIAPRRRFRITGSVDRCSRVSKLAGLSPRVGSFGSYIAWIAARAYQSWQVYSPEKAVSYQRARGSKLAWNPCISAGRLVTPGGRFRIPGRVGRGSRASVLAGLSPHGRGFRIVGRVNRSWQVYPPEAAASDHGARGS